MIPVMVVPILARPELLHDMLATIDYPIGDLVIIDNGHCVDQVTVKHVDRVHVVTMPSNQGVAGSWNLGIKSLPFAPWWLVSNFDVKWPTGSLQAFFEASVEDALVLSGGSPRWCAFSIGSQVVDRVGLFDEAFHPAYFEDDDMRRRCDYRGVSVIESQIPVHHTNSSTLKAEDYARRNDQTFISNRDWNSKKAAERDFSAGGWSLERRRALTWD